MSSRPFADFVIAALWLSPGACVELPFEGAGDAGGAGSEVLIETAAAEPDATATPDVTIQDAP